MVGYIIRNNIRVLWKKLNALLVSIRHLVVFIDPKCSVKCINRSSCDSYVQHFSLILKRDREYR